jgi:Leucine-rich repeat (LRR) protein
LFPKLQQLTIDFNTPIAKSREINKLGRSLNGASNLISLELHNCKLYQLEEDDFHAMVNLKLLKIKVDSMDSVNKLACLRELENLDLAYSYLLHTLGPDTFSPFPRLKQLNLRNCAISEIDPHAFDHLPQLIHLDMSANDALKEFELKRVCPRWLNFEESYDMRMLKLELNDESEVTVDYLSMLGGCELKGRFAYLNTMQITFDTYEEISSAPFKALALLEQLFLSFSCGKWFFRSLILHYVCIFNKTFLFVENDDNGDELMNGGVFTGLTSLKNLEIYKCKQLKRIERDFFEFMPNLECIDMDENSIESIEPGAFRCLTSVKYISMSGNKLERCPSLSELASLERLNLESNKIKSVDELFDGMGRDVMNTKLRVLDLLVQIKWCRCLLTFFLALLRSRASV